MADKFLPDERQRALYNIIEYEEKPYQSATNASAHFFRSTYLLISCTYLILFALSFLEWANYLMGIGAYGRELQYGSLTNTSIMMAVAITFSMSHYYIYMVFGHGYQHSEAQFYVDKYSTTQECRGSIRLMRGFYFFSLMSAVASFVLSWVTSKTSLHEQWIGFKNFLDVSLYSIGMKEYHITSLNDYSQTLIAYNWVASLVLIAICIFALLGVIQTILAKV